LTNYSPLVSRFKGRLKESVDLAGDPREDGLPRSLLKVMVPIYDANEVIDEVNDKLEKRTVQLEDLARYYSIVTKAEIGVEKWVRGNNISFDNYNHAAAKILSTGVKLDMYLIDNHSKLTEIKYKVMESKKIEDIINESEIIERRQNNLNTLPEIIEKRNIPYHIKTKISGLVNSSRNNSAEIHIRNTLKEMVDEGKVEDVLKLAPFYNNKCSKNRCQDKDNLFFSELAEINKLFEENYFAKAQQEYKQCSNVSTLNQKNKEIKRKFWDVLEKKKKNINEIVGENDFVDKIKAPPGFYKLEEKVERIIEIGDNYFQEISRVEDEIRQVNEQISFLVKPVLSEEYISKLTSIQKKNFQDYGDDNLSKLINEYNRAADKVLGLKKCFTSKLQEKVVSIVNNIPEPLDVKTHKKYPSLQNKLQVLQSYANMLGVGEVDSIINTKSSELKAAKRIINSLNSGVSDIPYFNLLEAAYQGSLMAEDDELKEFCSYIGGRKDGKGIWMQFEKRKEKANSIEIDGLGKKDMFIYKCIKNNLEKTIY